MNRLLLALTILRSRLRNGAMTMADFDQAFASAANYDNGSNLSSDLEMLRSSMLQDGADQLRILNRFIHQHQLHETPSRPLRSAERSANRERLRLANQASSEAADIARSLYPAAADIVLSGNYGNFMLGACRDASGQLIEDSLNDGELTGLNRILSLIRTDPSNGSLVRDELSGSIKLVIKIAPSPEPLPAIDPVHDELGFTPEAGTFQLAIVDQGRLWVDSAGQVLEIVNLTPAHAKGVIGYLEQRKQTIAEHLVWSAERSAAFSDMSDLAGEYLEEYLSRDSAELLEGTPLMKALRARVAGE